MSMYKWKYRIVKKAQEDYYRVQFKSIGFWGLIDKWDNVGGTHKTIAEATDYCLWAIQRGKDREKMRKQKTEIIREYLP